MLLVISIQVTLLVFCACDCPSMIMSFFRLTDLAVSGYGTLEDQSWTPGWVFILGTVGCSFFAAVFNIGWAATQVSHM